MAAVVVSSLLNVVQGVVDAIKLKFTFQVRWGRTVSSQRLNRVSCVRFPRSPWKDLPGGQSSPSSR